MCAEEAKHETEGGRWPRQKPTLERTPTALCVTPSHYAELRELHTLLFLRSRIKIPPADETRLWNGRFDSEIQQSTGQTGTVLKNTQ